MVNCLYDYLRNKRFAPLQIVDTPIFVATDSRTTTRMTMNYAAKRGLARVLTLQSLNGTDGHSQKTTKILRDNGYGQESAAAWKEVHTPYLRINSFNDSNNNLLVCHYG